MVLFVSLADRYTGYLTNAKRSGIKKGFALGVSLSYVFFLIFAAYSVAFW